jgi:hypothetical protein
MAVELTAGDGARELRRIERWLKVIAICFMVIAASAAMVAYQSSTVEDKLNEIRQDRLELLDRLAASNSHADKL